MNQKDIQIIKTGINDFNDVMEVEREAFGYDKEAELTADLLNDKTAEPILSLLAFYKDKPVGHILFTRVYLNQMTDQPLLHILAPLAVKPDYQKQGIGGMLIKEGLKILTEMGSKMVFVLGHMEYYPKYGFIPDAKSQGFDAPYPIPEEFSNAWMVQPLGTNEIFKISGKIICADKLNKPEHWRE
ncbi:MAG: N-acetyltransferase [Spirochaetales bacterium]|nr:N-acetyltransferase [Spirochaetales bacterium]